MKTYTIPNTDLETARFAYGTWHLGETWDNVPPSPEIKQRADTLIHEAVEQGITLIDLADIYTRGKSDMLVGEVIKNDPSLRDKLILQAKTGIVLNDEIEPGSIPHYDFSYTHIVGRVETSLKRLHTDHVELLLLHRPDPLVEPEEVARAFDELQSSGKVRYFGVSNHTPMQMELLKKYVDQPLVINQIEVSILHNELINDGIVSNMEKNVYTGARGTLDYCRLHDMMIQAWSPLARGQIFSPAEDAAQNVKDTAAKLQQLAEKYDSNPSAVAMAWLLRHPAQIQPIIGTMKAHRIAEQVAADAIEMSRLDWYDLFAAANGAHIP